MATSRATFMDESDSRSLHIDRSSITVQSTVYTAAGPSRERDGADGSVTERFRLFDDLFMDRKPWKEGTRIFKGYQIHSTGHETEVAIKMITPFLEKNSREVEHLLKLTPHPNVTLILRSKTNKDHACTELYIVMELCKFETLKDFCRETPFDFDQIVSNCKQILNGIKHIHDNNIIHGDLKPENILFSLCGKYLKVADFGISKKLQIGKSKTKRTSKGTDCYRAPETSNSEYISKLADIYSLGIIFFGMFTNGKHPFGKSPHAQLYNMLEGEECDFSGLPLEMEMMKKYHLRRMLSEMLQFDRKLRPTVDEVLADPFFTPCDDTKESVVPTSLRAERDLKSIRVCQYLNDTGEFICHMIADDKLLVNDLKRSLKEGIVFKSSARIRAKLGESLTSKLECISPPNLSFGENGSFEFLVDDVYSLGYISRTFQLEKLTGKLQNAIRVKCTLLRPDGSDSNLFFNFEWSERLGLRAQPAPRNIVRKHQNFGVPVNLDELDFEEDDYTAMGEFNSLGNWNLDELDVEDDYTAMGSGFLKKAKRWLMGGK